tara:strand:- start:2697 stop:2870 length:174 start_codon:yes stop_codon:yes gene_type:complete
MIDEDDELEILRRINIELLEENDELRNKIEMLEELAMTAKVEYNEDMLWKDAREEIE